MHRRRQATSHLVRRVRYTYYYSQRFIPRGFLRPSGWSCGYSEAVPRKQPAPLIKPWGVSTVKASIPPKHYTLMCGSRAATRLWLLVYFITMYPSSSNVTPPLWRQFRYPLVPVSVLCNSFPWISYYSKIGGALLCSEERAVPAEGFILIRSKTLRPERKFLYHSGKLASVSLLQTYKQDVTG